MVVLGVYKRKTNHKPLNQELLSQARKLVQNGVSIRQTAKEIGFHESSLRKKLKTGKASISLGRFRRVLTLEQEQEIVKHCTELDKRFFGLTLKSLRFLIYKYASENHIVHPFNDRSQLAGRDFTRAFMKRNKLSLRAPRKTSVARTMGFNRQQLSQYFDNLEGAFNRYGFTPDRIYNMDETGVQTVPNKLPKHVAPIGKREVAKSVGAEQGQTVTAVCAMSAGGHHVPPYFIFARKRMNLLLIKGAPAGCDMSVTDKGYMNIPTFINWLKHFKKFTNPSQERPILLILDNHVSHISLEAITFARSNDIQMLSLPPHSSHKTQPLDRIFFRPLKSYYDDITDNWTSSHPGQVLSVYNVAELFGKAFEKAATVEKATQGFAATGIFPLDRNKFTDDDFLPAEVTDQTQECEDAEDEVIDANFRQITFEADRLGAVEGDLPGDENFEGGHSIRLEREVSNAEVHAPLLAVAAINEQADDTTDLGSEPGPSHLYLMNTVPTSPADIIPLPKVQIKRKRLGKGLKSTLLTSSPNKERLEQLASEKDAAEVKKKARKVLFKPSKKQKTKASISSSSSDSESKVSLGNSDSELSWFSEEDETDDQHTELQAGEFALVKVFGKSKDSMRLYVAKIISRESDGYFGLFYKRTPKTLRFSETTEEAFIKKEDIFLKLSKPVQSSTARFNNMVTFSNDLSGLSIY